MNKVKDLELSIESPPNPLHEEEAQFAKQVLTAEAEAIERITIQPSFHLAVDLILRSTGHTHPTPASSQDPTPTPAPTPGAGGVAGTGAGAGGGTGGVVVSGVGKSGLIGQKISATLASTGTPSHFLHPTEAMHGDLGRIRRGDVVLLLSFGGTTEEVVSLAAILKQDKVPVICLVGKPDCDLARLSTVALCVGDVPEACPLNLAPTASTTAMLALGDALAMCVGRRRNFGVDEFRKYHPGGLLGKQLLPVVQAMRIRADQDLPLAEQSLTIQQALQSDMRRHGNRARRAGALVVVDQAGKLAGIFTDSDLRRLLIQDGHRALDRPLRDVMTPNPRRLTHDSLIRDAVQLAREFRIDEIPVVDSDNKPLGLIDVQDLIALKVIEE